MIRFSWDDIDVVEEWPIKIEVNGEPIGEFINFLSLYCNEIVDDLATHTVYGHDDFSVISKQEYEVIRAFLDISDIEYEDELHD